MKPILQTVSHHLENVDSLLTIKYTYTHSYTTEPSAYTYVHTLLMAVNLATCTATNTIKPPLTRERPMRPGGDVTFKNYINY